MYIVTCIPHNNPQKEVLLLSSFYRCGNWGTERCQITSPSHTVRSGRVRIQTRQSTSEPMLPTLLPHHLHNVGFLILQRETKLGDDGENCLGSLNKRISGKVGTPKNPGSFSAQLFHQPIRIKRFFFSSFFSSIFNGSQGNGTWARRNKTPFQKQSCPLAKIPFSKVQDF